MKILRSILGSTIMLAAFDTAASGKVELSPKTDASPDGRFDTTCYRAAREELGEQCEVSFYRLVAVPEKYHGRRVVVTGYLVQVFDRLVLYPSVERHRAGVEIEGIEIEDASVVPADLREAAKQGRVNIAVNGVFDARYVGLQTSRLGMLREVIRVFDATPPVADRARNW